MEKKNYFLRVKELTPTRFWINNVTKEEAHRAIEEGATGCTQNPSYVWKMINEKEVLPKIKELVSRYKTEGLGETDTVVHVQRDLVSEIAEIFYPLYEKSRGRMGYVSIQGDPFHEDADTIIRYARFNAQAGKNIMCKIPATQEGLKAIEVIAGEGIAINATEVMTVRQAMDVCRVYERATKDMEQKAPIYYSHITGILDEYLKDIVEREKIDIPEDVLWQAGIAAAKKTWRVTKDYMPEVGFIGGGARGLHHFTEMVGADACITINWSGTADRLIEENPVVVDRFHGPTGDVVLEKLCEKLPDFRKAYFEYAIEPEEYEDFGPVVRFRTSFEKAWKQAEEYVRTV